MLGALAFSGKSIFAKLAYAAAPIDAVTLITLRMLFSLPFFGAMIWWLHRDTTLLMSLGEAITLFQLAGAALVIAGVVLVSFTRHA